MTPESASIIKIHILGPARASDPENLEKADVWGEFGGRPVSTKECPAFFARTLLRRDARCDTTQYAAVPAGETTPVSEASGAVHSTSTVMSSWALDNGSENRTPPFRLRRSSSESAAVLQRSGSKPAAGGRPPLSPLPHNVGLGTSAYARSPAADGSCTPMSLWRCVTALTACSGRPCAAAWAQLVVLTTCPPLLPQRLQ